MKCSFVYFSFLEEDVVDGVDMFDFLFFSKVSTGYGFLGMGRLVGLGVRRDD